MKAWVATEPAMVRHYQTLCDEISNDDLRVSVLDIEHLPEAIGAPGLGPDVVLIDMPDTTEATRARTYRLLGQVKDIRAGVIVPEDASLGVIRRCLALGAGATLRGNFSAEALQHILPLMQLGVTASVYENGALVEPDPSQMRLSDRELQVLSGICRGYQNKEIAHGFNIKEVTVKMHVRAIIRKMGAKNRTHAAMMAREQGLVD